MKISNCDDIRKSDAKTTSENTNVYRLPITELCPNVKVVGHINLNAINQSRPQRKTKAEKQKEWSEKREQERIAKKQKRILVRKHHQEQEAKVVDDANKIKDDFRDIKIETSTINQNVDVFRIPRNEFKLVGHIDINTTNQSSLQRKSEVEKQKGFRKKVVEAVKIEKHNFEDVKSSRNIQYNVANAEIMKFRFYDGIAYYAPHNTVFVSRDHRFKKEYAMLVKLARRNLECKKAMCHKLVKTNFDLATKTFVCCNIDDLCDYLDFLVEKFLCNGRGVRERFRSEEKDRFRDSEKRVLCKACNIEFFDGYYKIWIVKNGVKLNDIQPLVVGDINSFACLQIVSKYFETKLSDDITIVYNNKKVLRLLNGFKLREYVEMVERYKNISSDWWNSLDYIGIKTLDSCRRIPMSVVRHEVSYKNIYIDYLVSCHGENTLLIAYELFSGMEEKCFVFNIAIDNSRSAIVYENINTNRATYVFVVNNKDYEESMNLIFNYFTDTHVPRKRESLRKGLNSPDKFKAIKMQSICHDSIDLWIRKLNDFLNSISQQIINTHPGHIEFIPGLKKKHVDSIRKNKNEKSYVANLHEEIKEKIYLQLSKEYGADNVGTEVSIGRKKIDIVVKDVDCFNIYEIKTEPDVRICIREAIGQIIDYAYFECKDKVGKLTIVGPSKISKEAHEYLKQIRLKHNLPVYYESI